MKEILLLNGFLQVSVSAILIYICAFFIFKLSVHVSLIIALAFSMSSTAIVLTYLKHWRIFTLLWRKNQLILIFQDFSCDSNITFNHIFLTNETLSIGEVLLKHLFQQLLS